MSKQLIYQYHAKVEQLIHYGGSRNESSLRGAFQNLLEQYARSKSLVLVPEVEFITKKGHKVYPDGTLKDALRQDWGYWESKDEKDDLKSEIAAKFAKGYPAYNILFEDTRTAVLYQGGEEVMRADFSNVGALDELLTLFISYERPEVREFRKAIDQFSEDVPELAKTLRAIIDEQYTGNATFRTGLDEFLELCRKAINPSIALADVREMVIQHILTEDIFMRVFDEADFHRDNAIAHRLQEVTKTFYCGATKRSIDDRIRGYYDTINARAAQISDHHEKQKFLKALYENFYKAYNPKAADRLGVIYTPNEIVRFMVESTDFLLDRHFGKSLGEPYVEILDPATGTGTFITEIIEHLPLSQLEHKYEHEIHCNEVAILPYYIANLNIEYSYKQRTGKYKEFENICFVDTLDNVGFSRVDTHQLDFFGLFDENAERIGRQNTRKISVVIGNPPYNANQLNENENNKNREYPAIDKRIKETYIKASTAQKTKLYDMYARFYRWASDRLDSNGIIAFISNRSFLDSKTFDGFRKVVSDEFSHIYIVDLGGDIRKNPKLSGPVHNVFAIQTGVAIAFFVKSPKSKKTLAKIYYARRPEFELAREKLDFLSNTSFKELVFENITPDKNSNWLNIGCSDWENLLPLLPKKSQSGISSTKSKTLFNFYSLGVSTNRDEWVYDFDPNSLVTKTMYFVDQYNAQVNSMIGKKLSEVDILANYTIKWSEALKRSAIQGKGINFDKRLIKRLGYRPFVDVYYYSEKLLSDRLTANHYKIFGNALDHQNLIIAVNISSRPFNVLANNHLIDLHFNGDSICLPFWIFDNTGELVENLTNWGLTIFRKQYEDKLIKKTDIFHYIYSVLHNPKYRQKYDLDLKRDFPHIPFYKDFWQWAEWGKRLMDLHLNYEQVLPYSLAREDKVVDELRRPVQPRLIARKQQGIIEVDTVTTLSGVPAEAWDYRLGTYTALEWVLERHKELTPKDPTIREKFNTYKFANYKEQVIDLLQRVVTVSVETMKIVNAMPDE